MSRSMTGYGRAEKTDASRQYVVEVKAVNSRFCEVKTHCPREFLQWDQEIAKTVRRRFHRGRFDVYVQILQEPGQEPSLNLDKIAAKHYYKLCQTLKERLNITEEIRLEHLFQFKDIFVQAKTNQEELWHHVRGVLESALSRLEEMSRAEGAILLEDITKRHGSIVKLLEAIDKIHHKSVQQITSRLQQRIEKLLGDKRLDQERLEQEVALLADRSDITEEIVRLKAHLAKINKILNKQGPVGRELDFVIQELHRETNTIGQKAQDYGLADSVIQIKSEIEKIREQVQNLE